MLVPMTRSPSGLCSEKPNTSPSTPPGSEVETSAETRMLPPGSNDATGVPAESVTATESKRTSLVPHSRGAVAIAPVPTLGAAE
ncbi:MAG: hypothetical protein BWX47_02048 [candidate division Hyd24-12 bacterium ADurb.Bin004]|nr:MAG: hypothetical protein BWX47_02048 [candidate division Hyd24-12 bacterium ADurb.Bin004]